MFALVVQFFSSGFSSFPFYVSDLSEHGPLEVHGERMKKLVVFQNDPKLLRLSKENGFLSLLRITKRHSPQNMII